MKQERGQQGFTLIELLLYISISASLLLLASTLFITIQGVRVKNRAISEVEQQGIALLQRATQSIRNAEAVTFPLAGASSSSLILDVADASLDPTTYSLSGTEAQLQEGGASAHTLTNNQIEVVSLSFSNVSGSGSSQSIAIELVLRYNTSSTRNEYAYEQTFYAAATTR